MYTEIYADREIKGKLTESEWKLLADSLNGTLVDGTFRFASSALVAHIEDADKFDSVGERWSVDVAKLCEKLQPCRGVLDQPRRLGRMCKVLNFAFFVYLH